MPRPRSSTDLAIALGTRIRRLREEKQLTQERLAWDCDLSKPYLSQIEAGLRMPSVPVLAVVAERLGVELIDLFVLDLTKPRQSLVEEARIGAGLRREL